MDQGNEFPKKPTSSSAPMSPTGTKSKRKSGVEGGIEGEKFRSSSASFAVQRGDNSKAALTGDEGGEEDEDGEEDEEEEGGRGGEEEEEEERRKRKKEKKAKGKEKEKKSRKSKGTRSDVEATATSDENPEAAEKVRNKIKAAKAGAKGKGDQEKELKGGAGDFAEQDEQLQQAGGEKGAEGGEEKGGGEEEEEEEEDEDEGREVIVHLDNIHKTYLLGVEGVPALRGVTLSVFRGEWLAIYGTSGGGKTTMLNIIGTIDKPTKGEMTVGEVVVNPDTKDHELASIRLNTLGFVFQTFNLLSAMSARENVELPMILKGEKSAKERRAIAEESLGRMGLAGRMDHFPNMLSGGEQQRVTIARAIANTPDLLLLDEPTGDLDSKNTDVVIKMLNRLNTEEGMTLVMVTHDMYLKNFADRVVWMRDGKIQRIEKISRKRKEEAFRELESNAKVQLSDVSTTTAAHGTPSVTTIKEEGWGHTEIRDPGSYRMFSTKKPAEATAAKKKKSTATTKKNKADA